MLRLTISGARGYAITSLFALTVAMMIPMESDLEWHQAIALLEGIMSKYWRAPLLFVASIAITLFLIKKQKVALSEYMAATGFMALLSPLMALIKVFPYDMPPHKTALVFLGTMSLYLSICALCGLFLVKILSDRETGSDRKPT